MQEVNRIEIVVTDLAKGTFTSKFCCVLLCIVADCCLKVIELLLDLLGETLDSCKLFPIFSLMWLFIFVTGRISCWILHI